MDREQDAERVDNIWKLARSVRVAMLTLHDGEALSARPMESLIPEGEDVVWFITDRYSSKIAEAWQNSDALLTYASQEKGEHLVLNGVLAVVDDRQKLQALWNKGADMYFPNGPDDPKVVLLRFDPSRGEYWTREAGAIGFALQFAKAKLTGSPQSLATTAGSRCSSKRAGRRFRQVPGKRARRQTSGAAPVRGFASHALSIIVRGCPLPNPKMELTDRLRV